MKYILKIIWMLLKKSVEVLIFLILNACVFAFTVLGVAWHFEFKSKWLDNFMSMSDTKNMMYLSPEKETERIPDLNNPLKWDADAEKRWEAFKAENIRLNELGIHPKDQFISKNINIGFDEALRLKYKDVRWTPEKEREYIDFLKQTKFKKV